MRFAPAPVSIARTDAVLVATVAPGRMPKMLGASGCALRQPPRDMPSARKTSAASSMTVRDYGVPPVSAGAGLSASVSAMIKSVWVL